MTAYTREGVAQIREGIREGSGLFFYDCPACPCDFGAMTRDLAVAEREAAEHDTAFHADHKPEGETS